MNKYKITLFLDKNTEPYNAEVEEDDTSCNAIARAISKIENPEEIYNYLTSGTSIAMIKNIENKIECTEFYTIGNITSGPISCDEASSNNPKILEFINK